jgi:cytoskeletal protein RodZ
VAHLFDNHPDDAVFETRPPPRRSRTILFGVAAIALAVLGAGSAVLWHSFGGSLPALPSLSSFTSASGTEPSPSPVATADKPVGLKDLQALQQQLTGAIQSNAQLLSSQQAELKRLADQVAVLTAKVDLLERPAASAQASVPPPAPPPPAPAAPRKRSAAPKQPAGISVGGAPLPSTQPAR